MAVGVADVRLIVGRVCSRPDVLNACRDRDLGKIVAVLGENGLTQDLIAGLTGLPQGRLSEYKTGKRKPRGAKTFKDFGDGLGLPSAARVALGLPAERPVDAGFGLPATAPVQGAADLAYPDTPADAAETVTRLWHRDLSDATALSQGRVVPGAWNDASLRWLVSASSEPVSEKAGRIRVGRPDVDRFRTTVQLFAKLDDQFGGGHARQALIQYLSIDGERLLQGQYSGSVGRQLFSAVSEAALLAAWMSYDSAPASSLAQKYFIQALALAQAGEDRLLGASVLDAMSHQATHLGRFGEAATLARAARTGTSGVATATLTSHFHAMEARALARLGDVKGCDRALAGAVREFERRKPEDDPPWFQYVDETELSAEMGHCLRDLGRAADAARYATRGLIAPDGATFVRSDFFVAMVLADAHLAGGGLEQACDVALKALKAGEQIRSARCINYLREFRTHLTRAASTTAVVEFNEQAGESRLWRIASRPGKGLS